MDNSGLNPAVHTAVGRANHSATATCGWVDRRARRTLCLLVDVDGSAGDDDKKVSQPARSAAESTSVSDLGPNLDRLWSYQCSTTRGRNVSCIGWNAANPVSIHCLLQASFLFAGGESLPQKNLTIPPKQLPNCALNLFFDRDNQLQIYHGNILLMDSKRRKLFVIKQPNGTNLCLKCTQIRLAGGGSARPRGGGAYALPQTP